MKPVGRNDPCTCGSGKKYKHCCGKSSTPFGSPSIAAMANPALFEAYDSFMQNRIATNQTGPAPTFMEWQGTPNSATESSHKLHAAMEGKHFKNEAEVNSFVQNFTDQYNRRGLDEFLGLSPINMNAIREKAAEEAGLLSYHYNKILPFLEQVPLLRYAEALLEILSLEPVNLTSAGYLPPSLVKQLHTQVRKPLPFWDHDYLSSFPVNKESDDSTLLRFREALKAMGLISIRTKKLSISGKGNAWLALNRPERYQRLYNILSQDLDWDKIENEHLMQPHPDIQQAWEFLLWILHQKAQDWVKPETLAEYLHAAFPYMASDYKGLNIDAPPVNGLIINDRYRYFHMLAYYGFEYIMRLLGLVEFKPHEKGIWENSLRVSPLFKTLITWHVKP